MKSTKFLAVLLLSVMIYSSCKKNKDITETIGDKTSQELMNFFDTFSILQIDTTDITCVNGLTLSEYNNYLKEKYTNKKSKLTSAELSPNDQLIAITTNIVKHQIPYTQRNVYAKRYPNQPNGLAYVWGGISDEIHDPLADAQCQEKLAGFDCSGLLYRGMLKSGINATGRPVATDLRSAANWNTWLKGTAYTNIEAEEENITTFKNDDWKTGDIIYFKNYTHVGTICIVNGKVAIVHSQGSNKSCEECKTPRRGPKVMTNDDGSWNSFAPKGNLRRVRFKLKNSYTISMKCSGMSYYLYTNNLSIDVTKSSTFTDEVVFKDYDGSINRQKFAINYDLKTQLFSISSQMTDDRVAGGIRTDEFKVTSSQLGQAVPSKVTFSGGMQGCDAEFMVDKGFKYNTGNNLKSSNTGQEINKCSITY